jgi:hypothetical protein
MRTSILDLVSADSNGKTNRRKRPADLLKTLFLLYPWDGRTHRADAGSEGFLNPCEEKASQGLRLLSGKLKTEAATRRHFRQDLQDEQD